MDEGEVQGAGVRRRWDLCDLVSSALSCILSTLYSIQLPIFPEMAQSCFMLAF